jgi:hypothetical protein
MCELCNNNERYHLCTESNNQYLCLAWLNKIHFGINAPRAGKSMVYAAFVMQYLQAMLKAAFVMSIRL